MIMKKVFITAAIILGGLSTYATSTMELNQPKEIVKDVEAQFREIKSNELPKAVLDALVSDFNRATVTKAYVNDRQEYKLHISIQEVTSAVHTENVYADKDGNWIDKRSIYMPVSNTTQEITNNFK